MQGFTAKGMVLLYCQERGPIRERGSVGNPTTGRGAGQARLLHPYTRRTRIANTHTPNFDVWTTIRRARVTPIGLV